MGWQSSGNFEINNAAVFEDTLRLDAFVEFENCKKFYLLFILKEEIKKSLIIIISNKNNSN